MRYYDGHYVVSSSLSEDEIRLQLGYAPTDPLTPADVRRAFELERDMFIEDNRLAELVADCEIRVKPTHEVSE